MKKLAFVLLSLLLLASCARVETWQPSSFRNIRNTTVFLEGPFGSCSGVVVAPNLVLSADHCSALGDRLTVNGKAAAIVREDSAKDLMLVATEVACPCAVLGDMPIQDSRVYLVGYPLAAAQILREGRFQELFTMLAIQYPQFAKKLVVSADVEPGHSGGGVYQFQKGRWVLIGIISAGSRTHTIAPGVDMIKEFLGK